ncbi:Acyl-coenzyme A thioesterase 9, mitochondrial [Ascosphaera aggregata]|nr:Acyl-coenzyme A thioesterase 9, mitochondrial [Ascosphaera aggregata]
MDLDGLAGMVAYKHTGDSVMTVTAAVDRIVMEYPLKEICDLELSGKVTYVTGRSSMEVSLQVARLPIEGQRMKPEDVQITCAFTMVSLDPTTRKSGYHAVIPKIFKHRTEEERQIFQKGEKNYLAKKEMRARHLSREGPNDEESTIIH